MSLPFLFVISLILFLSDLETPAQPIKALLLKHTRMSKNSAGERVYNSKNATQTR